MANRMRHQITDYERILRDYHKASFRHVVVFEAEISEDDKRHLFCQADLLRQCGNELLGIMKRRLEQLLRTKRYRGLRKYYGSLSEKLKDLEKVKVLSAIQKKHRQELLAELKSAGDSMKEMQEVNPHKETASNPMIMFLVLNTTGLTIVPLGVMVYRAQMGAANPSDIFLPILIATFCSTLVGLIAVCIKQRINLFDKVILGTIGGLTILIGGILVLFAQLPPEKVSLYSGFGANCLLFSIVTGFLISGIHKRINVYEAFIEGAKEGFKTAVTIIPYLVAILVAIAVFRASGAMDFFIAGITRAIEAIGIDSDFVGALPTALMKPLSGSGARGMMVDAMSTYGADSFIGRVASTIQGSTDTTFYILAVYFGSVGIRNTRYAAGYGLLADLAGIIAAIAVSYVFFH